MSGAALTIAAPLAILIGVPGVVAIALAVRLAWLAWRIDLLWKEDE